ncbi:MAG: FtsQ-type POTRA domain-containing protein, partial [Eubacteriales bacterium]|nr:FtsQ-type POTRA domain-containing protein [Eubacteriales bacterium]
MRRNGRSRNNRQIWTAPAETPIQDAGVIDLFAPDDETELPPPDMTESMFADVSEETALPFDTVAQAQETQTDGENADGGFTLDEALAQELLSPEEQAAERKRTKARARGLAACCLALLLIAFVAFLWFAFRVENITVEGNEQMQAEAVIEKSGVKKGVHMLALRTRAAEESLRMDPYIATAEVRRQYPNAVLISIRERKEAAVIVGMNSVAIIDGDGYVLSIGERESYAGLVKIYGAGSSG